MAGSAPSFVDGIAVLIALAKAELDPSVSVYEDIPDLQVARLPMVTLSRAGGSSDRPEFVSDFFTHVNVWSKDPDDPFQAAYELSRQVGAIFYQAWRNQTVARDGNGAPLGWIAHWRESSGFQRFTDPDLPHFGRYVGVLDLKIRNRRST